MIRTYQLEALDLVDARFVPDDIFGAEFARVEQRVLDMQWTLWASGDMAQMPRGLMWELEVGEYILTLCVDRKARRWREVTLWEIATGITPKEIEAVRVGYGEAFGESFFAARVRCVGSFSVAEAVEVYAPQFCRWDTQLDWVESRIRCGWFVLGDPEAGGIIQSTPKDRLAAAELAAALRSTEEPPIFLRFGGLEQFATIDEKAAETREEPPTLVVVPETDHHPFWWKGPLEQDPEKLPDVDEKHKLDVRININGGKNKNLRVNTAEVLKRLKYERKYRPNWTRPYWMERCSYLTVGGGRSFFEKSILSALVETEKLPETKLGRRPTRTPI